MDTQGRVVQRGLHHHHRPPPGGSSAAGRAVRVALRHRRDGRAGADADHDDREYAAVRPHRLRTGSGLPDDDGLRTDGGADLRQVGVLPVHCTAAHQAAGTEPRQLQESRKARCHPIRFRPAGQNRGLGSPKPGIGDPRYAELQPGHAGCAGAAKMAAPKGRMG